MSEMLLFTITSKMPKSVNKSNKRYASPLCRKLCIIKKICSVQFHTVTKSCPALCNPMDHSTPGLPVHHQLPQFTQTHIHRVGDAIQPPHPLLSPSPLAFNLSHHQGLFK